ncbi:hypothetical protein BAUCODRAFT_27684 [Baudoinia panamericana UAMH 10762]|uniref:DNA recombination and repair protein Rad51-like C-terminal domain-containing protein n=1 Tax=Baudoinia panamericana (strain UAMH 10762) TaxID=717646 RepID=M2N0C8_BAUPA|nr:uncharacterized protein BAUCODRAFT_27684 [Baudoinia panamericana UAMH 10762]EMC92394.1 hypothetical protein BAUCODRAFT_27684 [Baudoinia panamericana UAMH 10762]
MAEDLGKKLLAEVEAIGLDEILQTLRLRNAEREEHFRLPPLDLLIQAVAKAKPANARERPPQPPIVELTSTGLGGGITHLLYHLTALAVLPIINGGKECCVVVTDTARSFSTSGLAQQIQSILKAHATSSTTAVSAEDVLPTALKHVHIFNPQSLASTIATVDSLAGYLFDPTQHYSFERAVAFIALDSASAFYWQTKAEEEAARLLTSTADAPSRKPSSKPATYANLSTALRNASCTLSCPIILMTQHLSAVPQTPDQPTSLRPTVPAPLSQLPDVSLICYRIPIRKFPAGIGYEQALREAKERQQAVDEGRFWCAVDEWGLNEGIVQKLRDGGETGFGYRITGGGLVLEE